MVGGSLRRDSWDAIAKTKSLLSYGSLESLANLTNNASSSIVENTKTKTVNNESSNNSYRNESQNYSSLKKFSSSEYTYSPKITSNDSFSNSRGILKNKSANNVSGIDAVDNTTMTTSTTIKEKEQYLNNESSSFLKSTTTTTTSDKLVSGSAIEMLAVHKPTSFTLDQSLDASKIAVIVTGDQFYFFYFLFFMIKSNSFNHFQWLSAWLLCRIMRHDSWVLRYMYHFYR